VSWQFRTPFCRITPNDWEALKNKRDALKALLKERVESLGNQKQVSNGNLQTGDQQLIADFVKSEEAVSD